MDLGENIKKYRKQKGLTQKDLASKVGVTASTITKYEKGDLEPSLDTIKKIANVLDVPMATIIGDNLEIGFQAHIKGYADDVDSYYKSPSDVEFETTWDNITNIFDEFASNESLQKELNYQYKELNFDEQCTLENSVISILDTRLKLFKKYGSDALFNGQQNKLINDLIYQLIETMVNFNRTNKNK